MANMGVELNEATLRNVIEFFNLRNFFQDNSPERLAIVFGITALALVIVRFLFVFLQRKIEKFTQALMAKEPERPGKKPIAFMDLPLFKRVVGNSRRIIYLIIIYWGLSRLIIGPTYLEFTKVIFITLCIWATIVFFTALIPFIIDIYLRRHGATLENSQSRSLLPIIKGLIWAIGITFWLDNLGFHVSTIIAGLGIVGVAVGLAGQAILADFFSYIVILLDKPFRIGDFVVLSDGKAGAVEYMGPKTTHLRNLQNNLIICANSEMTKGILVNQGSIMEREAECVIGVAYETPVAILKRIPDILREVVESNPGCKFERACMLNFAASSLNFQLIYRYHPERVRGGVLTFMETQSNVNIAILDRFELENISIAYPTEHVLFTDLDPKATIKK